MRQIINSLMHRCRMMAMEMQRLAQREQAYYIIGIQRKERKSHEKNSISIGIIAEFQFSNHISTGDLYRRN